VRDSGGDSRNPLCRQPTTILFRPKAGVFVKETMNALADSSEIFSFNPTETEWHGFFPRHRRV
jgi:hypothetical protein